MSLYVRKEGAAVINSHDVYVTVVGFKNYNGEQPFVIGSYLICKKEPDNEYDDEAIAVYSYSLNLKLGYLASGYRTKAKGTVSAGRIYDKFLDSLPLRICFITDTKVICKVCTEGFDQVIIEEEFSKNDVE